MYIGGNNDGRNTEDTLKFSVPLVEYRQFIAPVIVAMGVTMHMYAYTRTMKILT